MPVAAPSIPRLARVMAAAALMGVCLLAQPAGAGAAEPQEPGPLVPSESQPPAETPPADDPIASDVDSSGSAPEAPIDPLPAPDEVVTVPPEAPPGPDVPDAPDAAPEIVDTPPLSPDPLPGGAVGEVATDVTPPCAAGPDACQILAPPSEGVAEPDAGAPTTDVGPLPAPASPSLPPLDQQAMPAAADSPLPPCPGPPRPLAAREPPGSTSGAFSALRPHSSIAPVPQSMPIEPAAKDGSPAATAGTLPTLPEFAETGRGAGTEGAPVSIEVTAEAVSASVIAIATPRVPTTVSVAVEFGKAGHGWAGAVVFNLWLRRQLRERRMSQRQLAHISGVDHSTISRLLAGGRIPSLETAAKLARALRVANDDIGSELGLVRERPVTAMQRVQAALRGDERLDDGDVKALMEAYIARRGRKGIRAVEPTIAANLPMRARGPDSS